MNLLTVEHLHVRYGAVTALHDISLTVAPGEVVTLIGANGAGKSTTLRAISGLLRPSSGTIHYRNTSLIGVAPHTIVERGLAHVPEGRGIFPQLTVAENLDLGAYARATPPTPAEYEHVYTLFPRIRERLTQPAGTLSGGEQQMVAMARAVLAKPTLLLLDEPSLGLAPQLVQTIFQIIRRINEEGTTIVLVEQNAHMALHVAHRAYVLECGRIVTSGPARELAASDAIRKAYLGL